MDIGMLLSFRFTAENQSTKTHSAKRHLIAKENGPTQSPRIILRTILYWTIPMIIRISL